MRLMVSANKFSDEVFDKDDFEFIGIFGFVFDIRTSIKYFNDLLNRHLEIQDIMKLR